MLEIRNRKILLSKINLCKSDVIIGDCAHRVAVNITVYCHRTQATGCERNTADFVNTDHFFFIVVEKT